MRLQPVYRHETDHAIVIAGGSGFLGQPLARALAQDGHDVVILTRRPRAPGRDSARRRRGRRTAGRPWAARASAAPAAVINLAGESIAARRWTAAQKQRIRDSRVLATRSLAAAIERARHSPGGVHQRIGGRLLRPARRRDRDRGAPARLRFPRARLRAIGRPKRPRDSSAGPASSCVRTGLVLGARWRCAAENAAAVPVRRRRPRRLGPAVLALDSSSRIGSIWCGSRFDRPGCDGPVNATAPTPVTNAEFARALGRALHRPPSCRPRRSRLQTAAGRDGGGAAALRPAGRAGESGAARLRVRVQAAGRRLALHSSSMTPNTGDRTVHPLQLPGSWAKIRRKTADLTC